MDKLTREQAAILSAFTGVTCGPFEDVQRLGDKLMGYPTFTHMYASEAFCEQLREKVRPMFLALCPDRDAPPVEGKDSV